MEVGGRSFSDHIRLLLPFLTLVAAVWAVRFTIDMMSAPPWVSPLFSVNMAFSVSVLLAVVLIHLRDFGGYANVILSALILVAWGNLLIIAAVVFSLLTGIDTIYTAPQYSLRDDPFHFGHILGHLTLGIGFGTLVGSATGCFLLYFLRLVSPARPVNP